MIDAHAGNVDYSPELMAPLKLADGCIVVVDAIEGCLLQVSVGHKLVRECQSLARVRV